MNLPKDIAEAVQPVFDALPPEKAMTELVVNAPVDGAVTAAVEEAVNSPALANHPVLRAGLWLYADDLDRSHTISQGIEDPTGAFWHGIMHRREGDFSNSHYWFRQVGRHPAMGDLSGYDPHGFIDAVEARHRQNPEDLIRQQQEEWQALFQWCAENA